MFQQIWYISAYESKENQWNLCWHELKTSLIWKPVAGLKNRWQIRTENFSRGLIWYAWCLWQAFQSKVIESDFFLIISFENIAIGEALLIFFAISGIITFMFSQILNLNIYKSFSTLKDRIRWILPAWLFDGLKNSKWKLSMSPQK